MTGGEGGAAGSTASPADLLGQEGRTTSVAHHGFRSDTDSSPRRRSGRRQRTAQRKVTKGDLVKGRPELTMLAPPSGWMGLNSVRGRLSVR